MLRLILAVAVSVAGCTKPCSDGTVFLEIHLGAAATADKLRISITVQPAGGSPLTTTEEHSRPPGDATESYEIAFQSGYKAGAKITIDVVALGDSGSATGTASQTLAANCTRMTVTIGAPSDASVLSDGGIVCPEPNRVGTFAGAGSGDTDGTLATVLLNNPTALSFGPDHTAYVAEYDVKRVRVLPPTGLSQKSAVQGDPVRAVVYHDGRLYLSPDGEGFVSCDAANVANCAVYAQGVISSWGMAFAGERLFFSNLISDHSALRPDVGYIDLPANTITPINLPTAIQNPSGMAISDDAIYVVGRADGCAWKIARDGTANATYFCGATHFVHPVAVLLDAQNNLYVSDDTLITRIAPNGVMKSFGQAPADGGTQGDGPVGDNPFAQPAGFAVDPTGADPCRIYFAEKSTGKIRTLFHQ